jgi:hypothetical protein
MWNTRNPREKIKNSWNFILRDFGGALKEVIPSCPNFSPNFQVLRAGTL